MYKAKKDMKAKRVWFTKSEFNCVCNGLAWFAENGDREVLRSDAKSTLNQITSYVFLYHDDSQADAIYYYGEPIVRTVLNDKEYGLTCVMMAVHDAKLDDVKFGDEDYFTKALEKIEDNRKAWNAEWERDKEAVRRYMEMHDGEKIVKAQVARELGVSYSRCLSVFRKLEDDCMTGGDV